MTNTQPLAKNHIFDRIKLLSGREKEGDEQLGSICPGGYTHAGSAGQWWTSIGR